MQSISTASTTIAVVASIVAAAIRFPVSLVGALGLMLGPFDLGNPCFVNQLTPTTKPSGLVSPLSLCMSISIPLFPYVTCLGFQAYIVLFVPMFQL